MPGTSNLAGPSAIAKATLTITRGVTAGWIAGVPQVVVTQIVGVLAGTRERADIGPRFVQRAAAYAGRPASGTLQWLIAGVFHFEYAAAWGALYALAIEAAGVRRVSPSLSGGVLGAIVYAAAFSPVGGATVTGAERPPERRSRVETMLHLAAACSFALTTTYAYRWLRERW